MTVGVKQDYYKKEHGFKSTIAYNSVCYNSR